MSSASAAAPTINTSAIGDAAGTITVMPYPPAADPEDAVNPPAPAGGNGGATAQGVTATSINVTQLMSLSGPNPGVFQGVADSAKAYVDYVNSLGGVFGRKINITVGDDAYDVVKDQAVCARDIPQSFAIVASVAFGETGCYPQVKSTGIPWVSQLVFDARLYGLPNVQTSPPNLFGNLEQALEIADHSGTPIKKVWLCNIQAPGIAAQVAPEAKVWESLGVQVLNLNLLPANATNYTAQVEQAKQAGADAVDCFSTPAQVDATIAREMAQQNWNPPIKRGYAVYDPNFVKLAGAAGKGWSAFVQVPVLDPTQFLASPGGKLYSTWLQKVNGKSSPTGIDDPEGWTAMEYFVQGLVKAGPDLTWPSVLAALKSIHSFNSNGLSEPFDIGAQASFTGCGAVVEDNGSALVQEIPAVGYQACGGKYLS